MNIIEILKAIVFGIVEGLTEFLPVSSTGHLILLDNLWPIGQGDEFFNMFKVVIQLGAILSVVVLYWERLWPFSKRMTVKEKRAIWRLWGIIIIAILPAAVIGLPFDDIIDSYLSTPLVIAITLVLYGIAFIVMEISFKGKDQPVKSLSSISNKTALFIGLFQCLSLIPGTSRSGATILGSMLLGLSRTAAAEFSFLLGIPTMIGASGLKLVKYFIEGNGFTGGQLVILITSFVASFFVAMLAIKTFLGYIKKHDFKIFGIYRIILGIVVVLFFYVIK
ncbi:MAG: undecaprenyl-diphosphate phosphatase [Eubacteriales bacterium]|nr:undecaprenyl-diphosphate phosphatase [Eubacteriales bacterium]